MNNANRKTLFIFNNLNVITNAVPQMVNTLNKHKYGVKIPLNVYDLLILWYGILDVYDSMLRNQQCATANYYYLAAEIAPLFFYLTTLVDHLWPKKSVLTMPSSLAPA